MSHFHRAPAIACFLSVLASLSVPAKADVIVVAADGSGDFLQINQAVNQAQDGDTILVRTGTYGAFVVPDRSVDVVADQGASVTVSGYAAVTHLESGGSVLLSGLTTVAQAPVHYGLYLFANAGSVRVRNCTFTGYDVPSVYCENEGGWNEPGGDAVRVEDCADVALLFCTARGGNGGDSTLQFCLDTGGQGGNGLFASGSSLALYECTIRGGTGGTSGYGGRGGDGVHLSSSDLFASGGVIHGGDGGDLYDVIPPCGDGGTGLYVSAGSEARILDVPISGGQQGCCFGWCLDGEAIAGPGSVTFETGHAAWLVMPRVAREGTSVNLTFDGEPGEVVFLARSRAPGWTPSLLLRGIWLLAPPVAFLQGPVGILDSNGSLSVSLDAPGLSSSAESATFHYQAVFVGPGIGRILSNAMPLVVVDSSF